MVEKILSALASLIDDTHASLIETQEKQHEVRCDLNHKLVMPELNYIKEFIGKKRIEDYLDKYPSCNHLNEAEVKNQIYLEDMTLLKSVNTIAVGLTSMQIEFNLNEPLGTETKKTKKTKKKKKNMTTEVVINSANIKITLDITK